MRLTVLASGGGSNFQSIITKIQEGKLKAEIAALIHNNRVCGAVEKAEKAGIRHMHLAPSMFESQSDYTRELLTALKEANADLIILAGYMKMLPLPVVQEYKNKILNIHPALLPAFGGKGMYGHHVHEAVLSYGAKLSGVTVHLANEEYDEGPVVMQRSVEVKEGDTPESLAKRVLELEHDTYWRAIQLFCDGRVTIQGRKVVIQ